VIAAKLGLRTDVLTDFNVYPLHTACRFGDVDLVLILRVGDGGEDLGWKLNGVAFGVLGFGGFPGCLLERRAGVRQLEARREEEGFIYVVWK
jgi:hypothetical protein